MNNQQFSPNAGMNSMAMGGMGGGGMSGMMGMGGGMGGGMGAGMGNSMSGMGAMGGGGGMNSMGNNMGMGMGGNMGMSGMNAMGGGMGGMGMNMGGMSGNMANMNSMGGMNNMANMAGMTGMSGGGNPNMNMNRGVNPNPMLQHSQQQVRMNYPGSGGASGGMIPDRPGTSMGYQNQGMMNQNAMNMSNMGMNPMAGGMGGNMGNMGGNMGGNMNMTGGMSPSSPQNPQSQQAHLHGSQPQSQPQPQSQLPHQPSPQNQNPLGALQNNPQAQAMLYTVIGHMGYTTEQFRNLPPQERNVVVQRAWSIVHDRVQRQQASQGGQNQNQGQPGMQQSPGMGPSAGGGGPMQGGMQPGMQGLPQQPQQPHERPGSSASHHSEMMPPPPRPASVSRPNTAMSMGRPGTGHGRVPSSPSLGPGPGIGRPPSRAMSVSNDMVPPGTPTMNGYPPSSQPGMMKPPGTPQMSSAPHSQLGMMPGGMPGMQQPHQHSPPPASPAHSDSHSLSHGQTPTIKRKASDAQIPVNGMVTAPNMGPRPSSAGNQNNMNMGAMGNMGMGGNMGQSMGMNMGPGGSPMNGMRHGSMPPPSAPSQTQIQIPTADTQRQGSLPPPGSASGMMGGMPGMNKPLSSGPGPVQRMPSLGPGGMDTLDNTSNQMNMGMPPQTPSRAPSQAPVQPPSLPQPGSTSAGAPPSSTGAQPTLSTSSTPQSQTGPQQPQQTQQQQTQPQPSVPGPGLTRLQPPPPLPTSVTLNPAVTKVTPVPLAGSDKTIPPLDASEIKDIKGWIEVDKAYDTVYQASKNRFREELVGMGGSVGGAWWEKAQPVSATQSRWDKTPRWKRIIAAGASERFDVRYPGHYVRRRDHERARERGRHAQKGPLRREGLKLPRRLTEEETNIPEQLVPIRLEFDVDPHYKMRDTFVWNVNDPVVTPEAFAQSLVEDYNLAPSYHSQIVKIIQDQLVDFKAHSPKFHDEEFVGDVEIVTGNLEDARDAKWWEGWRKRVWAQSEGEGRKRKKRKVVDEDVDMADDEGEGCDQPQSVEELVRQCDENQMEDDMRILVKLDITIGSMKLDDQFEWDIESVEEAERFAEIYARDLGLGGEFRTAIAHSIREQVQTYQKSLFLTGGLAGMASITDEDLRSAFLPPLSSSVHPPDEIQSFTPLLNYLSDGELERNEKEFSSNLKRRKRNTRGRRGVNLPDRDPLRTARTPAIGFPEVDPASVASGVGGIGTGAPVRRAAAAAASLTIANMVASENGSSPIMGQATLPVMVQSTPAPQPPKEKKPIPKGLFKSPPVPPEVLKPRAKVRAPTASTAVDGPATGEAPTSYASAAPPSRNVMPVKKTRESGREAKEKEFADGQHPNWIDGVWHCSNCGCPESIAIGRRKGPLGDKSQCGTCGKYWHRHRRPRPVEYNTDPDFHSSQKRETEIAKTFAKRKGGAAALRAQQNSTAATPSSEPSTPIMKKREIEKERAVSPVSTASSASESPLAMKVGKVNGKEKDKDKERDKEKEREKEKEKEKEEKAESVPPEPSADEDKDKIKTKSEESENAGVVSDSAPGSSDVPPSSKTWPPQWLHGAIQATQSKYPSDKFEVVLRKVATGTTAEWRIKCIDCPGKLYKPGPGETLSNFEVHLKNRQHRQRVDERLGGGE